MVAAYTVALVGFSQAESSTFESFFRLAARRPPAYRVQDEVLDAQILIVNADNRQALMLVKDAELPGRVLLVGNSDGGTGWALQHKPVKLVALLAALDQIVGAKRLSPEQLKRGAPPGATTDGSFRASQFQGLNASMQMVSTPAHTVLPDYPPSMLPSAGADRSFAITVPYGAESLPALAPGVKGARQRRSADTEFPLTRPMQREEPRAVVPPAKARSAPAVSARMSAPPVARPGVMNLTDFGGLDELPSPPSPAPRSPRSHIASDKTTVPETPLGDMLLVAESLVEGRILLKRFKRYGLSVDWSRDAPQAVTMLKAHAYRLVVIDRLSGQPDGNQVCRTAKQTKGPKGAPVVIMFAPTAGSMDRMKAGLAGSDAYLSRSVGEADLYKVLAHHRLVHLDGFAPTNVGF